MKHYKLPENVLQGLLNYLASRPYVEVQEAIPVLQKLEVIEEKEVDATEQV